MPAGVAGDAQPRRMAASASTRSRPRGSPSPPRRRACRPRGSAASRGCVLNCCSTSWTDEVASRWLSPATNPIDTRAARPRGSSGRSTSRRTRSTSRRCAAASPSVWMRRSSGSATFQTSLTPSSHSCGSWREAELADRGAGQVPPACPRPAPWRGPRGRCRARSCRSSSPSLAAALVAGAHAAHDAVLDEQRASRRSRSGGTRPPPRPSRPASAPAPTTEMTSLPWFLNGGGVGMRSAPRAVRQQ